MATILIVIAFVLGYWAGVDYWGEGYTSEAVEAFLGFCKEGLGLSDLTAKVFKENEASLRLLKSLGFSVVARRTVNLPERGGRRKVIHLRHKSF